MQILKNVLKQVVKRGLASLRMSPNRVQKKHSGEMLLPNRNTIISDEYLALQKKLHELPHYGTASLFFAPMVAQFIRKENIKFITDYGAGKQNLRKGLAAQGITSIEYAPYDPVFPEYGPPTPSEFVCCIDVLEHIEPELLDNVLAELASLTQKHGFFSIHLGPAQKILADGRNAHLIQQPASWWIKKLSHYFEIREVQEIKVMGNGLSVIVAPKRSS